MANQAQVLSDVDEPNRIVRVVHTASKIATHLRPDLDALLAVWMCQRLRFTAGLSDAEVLFLPANAKSVDEDTFAVDMGTGKGLRPFGKGHCLKWSSHPNGGSASMAFWRALPEDEQGFFKDLVFAISSADQGGENVHKILLKKGKGSDALRDQVMATNIWSIHTSLLNVLNDKKLLEFWSAVFDGTVAAGLQHQQAKHMAERTKFLLDGTLAIIPHDAPPPTSKMVFEKGARLAIFSSEIGPKEWILGVTRSATHAASFINLAEYEGEILETVPGAYVHPAGFLVGWTATAPFRGTAEEFWKTRTDLQRVITSVLSKILSTRR